MLILCIIQRVTPKKLFKMRLLYITRPSFFDADLSLIKSLGCLIEITVLLDLPKYGLRNTALTINNQDKNPGIKNVSSNLEFSKYRSYIKGDFFIINRPKSKLISKETLIVNYEIKKLIKKLNPDLIHYNNFCHLAYFAAIFNNNKKILTVHDPLPHIGESSRNLLYRRLNFLFLKKIILLNEYQKTLFLDKYNIKKSDVFISRLSVYEFYKDSFPQLSNNIETKLDILFFGRVTEYKGIDILLDAFQILRKTKPDVTLTIAGKGTFDYTKYNLQNVRVLNRYIETKELYHLISNSAFAVCPYIEATQSGVIMTAYSLCKPVVATNVGGLPEMVKHNVTGLLVNPNNPIELSLAMLDLLNNPLKRKSFSKNIFELYFKNGEYSWATISKNLLSIYKEIAK